MKQLITIFLALLIIFSSCKNPLTDLNDFKLNINSGAMINSSAVLSFVKKGQSGLITSGLRVSITGKDAQYVYDELGTKEFALMPDGKIKLILSPRLNPNPQNPASFTVRVEGEGIFPFEQDVFIFDKTQVQELEFNLESLSNLSPDKRHETKSLSFLGKKKSDTLVFTHTNSIGIQFAYKYPVNNATFISTRKVPYSIEETRTSIQPIYKDTAYWKNKGLKDTSLNATEFLINNTGTFPLNGTIIKVIDWQEVKEKVVERYDTINRKVLVWYEQEFLDTIPVENVTAEINSSSRSYVSLAGFVNENGVEIDKPANFEQCTLFPNIKFKTTNGNPVNVVYKRGGPVISVQMPDNSPVNLFLEGIHFEVTTGQSLYTSLIIPSSKISIKGNGEISLVNNIKYVERMFFFKQYTTGCGFAKVLFDTKTIDLSTFDVGYSINTPKVRLSGRLYGNNETLVRVPAFSEENSHTASVTIDHSQNRCEGGPLLYNNTQTISNPCNFISNPFNFVVDYNGSSFLSKYPFYPVEVNAKLVCVSGSEVFLPDQTIKYERQGCASGTGSFTIREGKGYFSMIGNSVYKITAIDPNSKLEVSENLPLNVSNVTGYTLQGKKTSSTGGEEIAYSGTIKFDPVNRKFVLDVNFQNKVFKFKIPGCN